MGYGIDAGSVGAGLSGFAQGMTSGFAMGDRLERRKQEEADRTAERERQARMDALREKNIAEDAADRATARDRAATEWDWKKQDRAKLDAMNAELSQADAQFQDFSTPLAGGAAMPRGIDAPGTDTEKGAQVAADSSPGTAAASGKAAKPPATDPRDLYATGIEWARNRAAIYAKYGRTDLMDQAVRAQASFAEQYQAALDRSERAGERRKAALANFAKEETGALLETIDRADQGDPQALEFYNLMAPPGYMLQSVEPTSNGFKITRENGKSFTLTRDQADTIRSRLSGKGGTGIDPETVFKSNRETIASLQKQLAEGILPPAQAAEARVKISELEDENDALRQGKKPTRDPQARGLALDAELQTEEDKAKARFDALKADDWGPENAPTAAARGRLNEVKAERAARDMARKRQPGIQPPAAPTAAEKTGQGGTGAQAAPKQAAPAAGATMVRMKDPRTGEIRAVRADYVEMARSKGLVLAE